MAGGSAGSCMLWMLITLVRRQVTSFLGGAALVGVGLSALLDAQDIAAARYAAAPCWSRWDWCRRARLPAARAHSAWFGRTWYVLAMAALSTDLASYAADWDILFAVVWCQREPTRSALKRSPPQAERSEGWGEANQQGSAGGTILAGDVTIGLPLSPGCSRSLALRAAARAAYVGYMGADGPTGDSGRRRGQSPALRHMAHGFFFVLGFTRSS